MKKIISLFFVVLLTLSLIACSGGYDPSKHQREEVKVSQDRTIAYVEDFVGLTLDQVGYDNLLGQRATKVGEGILKLVITSTDGTSIDISDEENLKNYIIAGQDLKPNTEIKFTFDDGPFPTWQSYEQMFLKVIKVGEKLSEEPQFTQINPSDDNEHYYIRDYVGLNLHDIGFTNLFKDRVDVYGESILKFIINTEDNTKIFIEEENDEELLKDYVVVSQNIEPNSLMQVTYNVDENGKKESIPSFSSYQEIVLNVAKIGSDNSNENIVIKPSIDNTIHYVRNYVGRNLADCGYTNAYGECADEYGNGYIKLSLVCEDGKNIELDEDETYTRNYVVVAQNISPNTELRYTLSKDGYFMSDCNYDEILLELKEIGSNDDSLLELQEIKASPDKYTKYLPDYVGRNLSQAIKLSVFGTEIQISNGYIDATIMDEEGHRLDITEDNIKNYVVTKQDLEPNTEIKFTYLKDSKGNEYDNLVDETSVKNICLTVKELN